MAVNQVKKTASKLDFEIIGIVPNETNGTHEIEFKVKNPLGGKGSIKNFRYKSPDDNTYYNATFYSTQLSGFDKDTFQTDPKFKKYKVVWDSIADMRMHQNHDNVTFELTLADEINGGGNVSESKTFVTNVHWKLSQIYQVTKPRSNQKDLTFQFNTPKILRNCRVHYQIKVDKVKTFNSADLQTFKSADSTSGWTYTAGSSQPVFPVNGITGGPNSQIEVFFSNNSLNSLSGGTYYFEVMPIPTQFIAEITSPSNGAVFQTTSITISGTITNL